MKRGPKKRVLYSVWRNSDDSLLILDGTAEQCCRRLRIAKSSFYSLVCNTGKQADAIYTITKSSMDEIEREVNE